MAIGIDLRIGFGLFLGAKTSYSVYQLVAGKIPDTISRVHTGVSRIFDVLSAFFYALQWSHQANLIHLKHFVFPIFTMSYAFIGVSSALHLRECFYYLDQLKGLIVTEELLKTKKQYELDCVMHAFAVLFGIFGLGKLFLGLPSAFVTVMGVAWIVAFIAAKSFAVHRWDYAK